MAVPFTPRQMACWLVLAAWLGAAAVVSSGPVRAAEPPAVTGTVDYVEHIKPILADRCYACHGPDQGQRQAELRLDLREAAVASVIVPGSADESELLDRISSADPDLRMPPAEAKKPPLSEQEIALVRAWIDQGAPFEPHWAFVPPERPEAPPVQDASWPAGDIDRFVLARLEQEKLAPAPAADRRTLLRRLTLDLTGLPPTTEEVEAFMADASPDAYERLVDRLLASQHYGERMAMYWLDLVRYADTNGIHGDNHREHSPYRDYVIRAFNDNLPFDRFTVEQLAGDLLPDPTRDQRIASGYNRLNMTTREGGAQPKEYIAKYAADRVRNASSVWMGATLGCAECHDHKFDPYTAKDFYSFAAFFADVQETAVGAQQPTPFPSEEQSRQLAALDARIAAVQEVLDAPTPELAAAQADWERGRSEEEKEPPKEIAAILDVPADERNEEQQKRLAAWYRTIAPLLEPARQELAQLKSQREELQKAIPLCLITVAVKPREVRILPRGNWLDDSGEVVLPAVPGFLDPVETAGERASRLDLARWLVATENPLTARVTANRLWLLLFGRGLVATPDDFGSQGSVPSHPKLLDWLACEFVESGWDVKHMLKLIAMSSTYRQASDMSEPLRRRDAANRLLARQNRYRLEAETVRDHALAASGLLVRKIGGPSVRPYQPAGYWAHLNFPKREYQNDSGENLYRRGLYTYWCRTFLHPSLLAFDAPTREECAVERPRSNTPLQALVLLNDPIYVEAARVLAERAAREGGTEVDGRIAYIVRETLARRPSPEETQILTDLYEKHLAQYRQDENAAREIIRVGDFPVAEGIDPAELAAWTSIARVVFNLHETITRY